MIYVMSDIHGCYDKYQKMLKKINLSKADTLYILGDVVDRGPNGMRILLDIARSDNVILLRGNHDQQAAILLSNLYMLDEKNCPKELVELYGIWLSDGGKKTLSEYLSLTDEERKTVIEVLKNSLVAKEIKINGKIFLMAHTVPGANRICDYEKWSIDEYIWGEPDYEEVYFADKYIITGHTPTEFISQELKGKIWMGNKHIAIDCGAVFGNSLGCLCLDTFEEFYVS